MGDCGLVDGEGRLWYLGRKVERVLTPGGTLFTEPCEQVFRTHPRARRCALIGLAGEPALVVEARVGCGSDAQGLAEALRALGQGAPAHFSHNGVPLPGAPSRRRQAQRKDPQARPREMGGGARAYRVA